MVAKFPNGSGSTNSTIVCRALYVSAGFPFAVLGDFCKFRQFLRFSAKPKRNQTCKRKKALPEERPPSPPYVKSTAARLPRRPGLRSLSLKATQQLPSSYNRNPYYDPIEYDDFICYLCRVCCSLKGRSDGIIHVENRPLLAVVLRGDACQASWN